MQIQTREVNVCVKVFLISFRVDISKNLSHNNKLNINVGLTRVTMVHYSATLWYTATDSQLCMICVINTSL